MGLFLGIGIFSFLYAAQQLKKISMPFWFMVVISISLSLTFGVLWEFYEFAWDHLIVPYFNFQPTQLSVADTLSDILIDIVGAMLGVTLIFFMSKTKKAKAMLVKPFEKYLQ